VGHHFVSAQLPLAKAPHKGQHFASKATMPTITKGRLRSAIKIIPCDHISLCHGYSWEIIDENALAQLVAWIMVGRYDHAQRILARLPTPSGRTPKTARDQAIEQLTLPPSPRSARETKRVHRDGLVFQHISWLAAHTAGPIAASPPHTQPADKGFDALIVPLKSPNSGTGEFFVCEDKATEDPRGMINSDVWPGFDDIEKGKRDAELKTHLTTILSIYPGGVPKVVEIVVAFGWSPDSNRFVSPVSSYATAKALSESFSTTGTPVSIVS
jgi:hypothetical protein